MEYEIIYPSLYLEEKKSICVLAIYRTVREKLLAERKLLGKKFLILLPSFFLPSLLMRNSKQGITEMGRGKRRQKIIIK